MRFGGDAAAAAAVQILLHLRPRLPEVPVVSYNERSWKRAAAAAAAGLLIRIRTLGALARRRREPALRGLLKAALRLRLPRVAALRRVALALPALRLHLDYAMLCHTSKTQPPDYL